MSERRVRPDDGIGYALLLFAGIASTCLSPPARADQWSITGQASERLLFDSNIRLSRSDRQSVFGSVTSLQSTLGWADPGVSVNLTGAASVRRYAEDQSLNGEDFSLALQSHYQRPRSTYGLGFAIRRASTLITEELDSGDFTQNAVQYSLSVQPSWQYRLTRLDTISVTGGWSRRFYEDGDFSDSDSFTLGTSWQRKLSPVESISLGVRGSYIRTDSSNRNTGRSADSQSVALLLGWNRQFSKRLSIGLSIGPRLSVTNNDLSGSRSPDLGTDANFQMRYKASTLTDVTLQFGSSLEPASTGAIQERQRITIALNHRLTRRARFSFSASGVRNGALIAGRRDPAGSQIYLSSSAGLTYQLTPALSASVQYVFRTRRPETENSLVFSHAVAAVVTYNWQGWRFRD